jgi:hypothetical protein
MKKKSIGLLLGLLPLMTCCTVERDEPEFRISEFNDSRTLQFDLKDGLDLTVPFGLYNKSAVFGDRHFDKHYMFLAANIKEEYASNFYEDLVWTRFYDVNDRNQDCFWEYKKGSDGIYNMFYSKQTTLHLDSSFFDYTADNVEIILTYALEFDSNQYRYNKYELGYPPCYYTLYYSIDENERVTVTNSPDVLPRPSSSESHSSSSDQEALSTEESIESSEAVA